ncbi:hypothetical protein Tco_0422758 [Tanacetum coccineum]
MDWRMDLNEEFNHLLQIDIDVLTGDLPGFKTYEDYKNAWIYEWNNEVLWDEEKPWHRTTIPKLSGDSFLAFLATT